MRPIDADALKPYRLNEHYKYRLVYDADDVANATTIDAVSVVRCRECKHKYQEPWNNGVAVEGECEIWHSATLDNDFCSYGERKESE